ncbi:MAG: hypothetical protein U1F58_17510 [Burkholderiales bacterium]
MTTDVAAHPLDNPIWSALTARQAHQALGFVRRAEFTLLHARRMR